MLNNLLKERALLPILQHTDGTPVTLATWDTRRREMRHALEVYSYGHTLPAPKAVWGTVVQENPRDYAGKVLQQTVNISFETERGVFTFPVFVFVPHAVKRPCTFLHIAFRYDAKDKPPVYRMPVEEITDQGYALVQMAYTDVVNDNLNGDYSNGLAAYFGLTNPRGAEEWGKIGLWAYAASRTLDYLFTRDDIDAAHTAVIGHSRLGKTALWTAAQDERFWCAISNNSGYGGAATSKHGTGERVRDFLDCGSWDWFCENFKQFTDDKEDCKPYDQSWLLSLIAPRLLCVGSAVEDTGADPVSEFLTSLWASQAWDLHGVPGLVTPDRLPTPGDRLFGGRVGYFLRAGTHFLCREDWNAYIQFLNSHS